MDKHNFVERSPKNDTSVLAFTYPYDICPRLQATRKRLKSIAEAFIFVSEKEQRTHIGSAFRVYTA
jgi:hypothetical protein